MSPLTRYYSALGSMAVVILATQAVGGFLITTNPRLAVAVILFLAPVALLCGAYAVLFCRCPTCRLRLSARRSGFTHGIPGRICPRCQTDLSVPG